MPAQIAPPEAPATIGTTTWWPGWPSYQLTTCRVDVARAAKALISLKLGRPIQPMQLSEMRECAAGGSRAANALQSKDVIHRADHVYRQRSQTEYQKRIGTGLGGFRT